MPAWPPISTHSLIFVLLGGLACAVFFHWVLGRHRGVRFGHTYHACALGYLTHRTSAPADLRRLLQMAAEP